MIDKKSDQ